MSRVLLVDDEPELLKVLAFSLKYAKHETLRAASIQEARAIFQEAFVDVLITDLQLPGGTGLDFIREARQLRPSIRAILLTGLTDFSHSDINALGVEEVFYKPFDLSALVSRVGAAPQVH